MSQSFIILLILGAYIVLWLAVTYLSSRKADETTFFAANKKIPWYIVAIAMLGAPITGVTFLSVPGMVATKGLSYIQMCLGFIIGYFLIAFVLVPIYYKLNIISIYEYLKKRFGYKSYKTGAWLFFISKILGISIRFLMICTVIQLLILDQLGIPFIYSVIISLILIVISTYKGGVRSVIFGDVLKSFCLIATIILCLYFIIQNLGLNGEELRFQVQKHSDWKIFYFDNPSDTKYFWKQFIAGIFIVIAMTGLDQDMMQRTLSCPNAKDSKKNLIVSTFLQFFIMVTLLTLGCLMIMYIEVKGIEMPSRSDDIFATVAFDKDMPYIVGGLFMIGIISSTISSMASALTSMTTTVSIDILGINKEKNNLYKRNIIHIGIAFLMAIFVILFFYLNEDDAISTIYTLISYTDGPILGLFLFGIFSNRKINEKWLPIICISAPLISFIIQQSADYLLDYKISFELLIINASITIFGLLIISTPIREVSKFNQNLLEHS